VLDACGAQGFDVFPGSETFLLRAMRHGGAGCISATANVNPAAIARLHATWRQADADEQQRRLDEIRAIMQTYVMIPALKAAIAHWAGDPAWRTVRPPLESLTQAQAAALVAALEAKGFSMPGLRG
jgi:4-hydroxy-tetrahydrodipicolinate synthase